MPLLSNAMTAHTRFVLHIWIQVLLSAGLNTAPSNNTYLFGADPAGGVWGAKVDVSNAESQTIANIGYLGIPYDVGTVSYDAYGKQILLECFGPHRLEHGPFCANPPNESFTLTNVTSFPIFINGVNDCLECHASSFAYHENRVYFIMVGTFGPYPNLTKRVQLRVLQPCKSCAYDIIHAPSNQVFSTPFLFNCSSVVSEVYSTTEYSDRSIEIKAGRTLKIFSEETKLGFFFQVFDGIRYPNRSHYETHLTLYHVTPTSDVVRLRREKIHRRYAQWNIHAVASVDYKDGALCWTAGDRLYCGELQDMELKNIRMLLYPGEAVAAQVCTGSKLDLLAIITGVAIARADREKVLFFGCFPSWVGLGGTGMIRLTSGWSEKYIKPVIDSHGARRLAGSLFTTDAIPDLCPITELPPEICPTPPPSYTQIKDEPVGLNNGMKIEVIDAKEAVKELGQYEGGTGSVNPQIVLMLGSVGLSASAWYTMHLKS